MNNFLVLTQLVGFGLFGGFINFAISYGKDTDTRLLDYIKGEFKHTLFSLGGIISAALLYMAAGTVDTNSMAVFAGMVSAGFLADNKLNKAPGEK